MTDSADLAEFEAYKKAKADEQALREASRIQFPEVLHRLIQSAPWNHEGEKLAAHDAVDRHFAAPAIPAAPAAVEAESAPPAYVQ